MLLQPSRLLAPAILALLSCSANAQQVPTASNTHLPVRLEVPAGTPLRLYLTRRASYRQDEAIEAKFAEPVWAFDRIVIPAGTLVDGRIVSLDPVSRAIRTRAIVGGDFTPLKRAFASFTVAHLPNGTTLTLDTQSSVGLPAIFVPPRPSKHHARPKNGKLASAQRFAEQQATIQLNARSWGLFDFVRGPNKREWLENFALSKLPYHPQWYRSGTRFDAVLEKPLDFGTVDISSDTLQAIGTPPPPDSLAQMRLLSTISSADSQVGDKMEGVLAQPLFNQQHKLILPEGTRVSGKVTLARPARFFHRGGKLRFTLESVELPHIGGLESALSAEPVREVQPAQAQLAAVEAHGSGVKVDREGTAKATESKTRLLRPAIAGIVAAKSIDNDAGKQTASGTPASSPNPAGHALGGFSGFGLLGMATMAGPAQLSGALGFYGLAWSVYSTVVSRGSEVTFQKNADLAIRFGTPPESHAGKSERASSVHPASGK